jgi:hypothetical protein
LLAFSEILVTHGREGVVEYSSSHHGGQGAETENASTHFLLSPFYSIQASSLWNDVIHIWGGSYSLS